MTQSWVILQLLVELSLIYINVQYIIQLINFFLKFSFGKFHAGVWKSFSRLTLYSKVYNSDILRMPHDLTIRGIGTGKPGIFSCVSV